MSFTPSTEDFAKLFEQSTTQPPKSNQLVKGTVVRVLRDFVLVDIGAKSEGQIPIDQFRNLDGEVVTQPGDVVDVVFESIEDEQGRIVVSKEKADALAAWDRLVEAEQKGTPIEGLIVNKIKGGMVVDLGGVKAFLPGSQIDLKPVKSLDKLIHKKYRFKILKLNRLKGNVVVSRRAVLEEEREVAKTDLLANLKEGQVVEGYVKNITDYGAFIDLGGADGLLHITDVSWGRINHPSEVLQVGQKLNVLVLKYDESNQKVSLGLKQLAADPWESVGGQFTVAERVKGKVVNVTDYGAFVELSPGVEGLVHVSEMSWTKKVKHPSKVVTLGDVVEAIVLDVDPAARRISLGMKQIEPNPWNELENKYPIGTKIKGDVKNVTDFGVFVGVEEGIDGLVHVSDLSWTKKINHPSDLYKKGDLVEAVVLNIDKTNERFSLGVKQLEEDPFGRACTACVVGKAVEGKVKSVEEHGVFLDIGYDEVDGFIPQKELAGEVLKVGETVESEVIGYDEKKRNVQLSLKQYQRNAQKRDLEAFRVKQGAVKATLSDLIDKD